MYRLVKPDNSILNNTPVCRTHLCRRDNQLNSKKEIYSIWEYKVKAEYIAQFQKAYGAAGEWAILFQKCPGYLKTKLKRDIEILGRYVTIDHWRSYSQFADMKNKIGTEYGLLDQLCEVYTESEKHIGVFEIVEGV